jgi:hypothetical protein
MRIDDIDKRFIFESFRSRYPELLEDAASEIYRQALRLLGNLIHYRSNGNRQAEDVIMVMEILHKGAK